MSIGQTIPVEKPAFAKEVETSSENQKDSDKQKEAEQEELELDYGEDAEVVKQEPQDQPSPNGQAEEPILPEKRLREVTPCRYPDDPVIIIRGLVRPFTLPQLKDEIQRDGGQIMDFWIDDKRSHCIVEMKSVEQASSVRARMRGMKWPNNTPKSLTVHFDNKLNLEKHKAGLPGKNVEAVSNDRGRPKLTDIVHFKEELESVVRRNNKNEQVKRERLLEGQRELEVKTTNSPSEEVKEETERKRRRIEPSPQKKQPECSDALVDRVQDQSPKEKALSADELFKKTKSIPCIYYLPASEEEAKLRSAQREADAKRDARRSRRH